MAGAYGKQSSVTGFLSELFSLDGRVAVVTGGSSGIGEAMASALALAGARVVLVARDPTRLSATSTSLCEAGCSAAWVSADLSDRAEVRRAASAATAAFGEPDILVNCAGVNLRPPLASLSEEHWDLMVAVNLTAPFLLGQRLGPDHQRHLTAGAAGVRQQRRIRRVEGRPRRADPVPVRGVGEIGRGRELGVPRLRRHPAHHGSVLRPGALGGAGGADHDRAERGALGLRRGRGVSRVNG